MDMVTELNVMKSLKPHRHVLKLIGCCSRGGKSNPTATMAFQERTQLSFLRGEVRGKEFPSRPR